MVLQESQVLRVTRDFQEFQDSKVRKVSPASRELKEIKETKASLELKVGESVILAGALLMNRGCMKAPELAESGSLVLHV